MIRLVTLKSLLVGFILSCPVVCGFNITLIPRDFSIGAATSAYQGEGTWNIDGKDESNCCEDNGNIACNSYYQYCEDVRLLKTIGFHHYRFSLSWSRILPKGFPNAVNKREIAYQKNLVNELRCNGIEPYATLYHWDHPEALNKFGGWTNELMIDWFVDYARVVFRELGDQIKFFTTINDPAALCQCLYGKSNDTAGTTDTAVYICGHNILKAHARVYYMYNSEFRSRQRGQIGITLACNYHYPGITGDSISEDVAFDCDCGWFANPIFSAEGDYPRSMKQRVRENSIAEGRATSRLPEFSSSWINYIRGSSDYFGLNHYTSDIVRPVHGTTNTPYYGDTGLLKFVNPNWRRAESPWLYVVPDGFGQVLRKIKTKYNNPPVYVLENGYSDNGNTDYDYDRIDYHYCYMKEMFQAMRDGCNIKAYTVRNLMDNFQSAAKYKEYFGLVHFNFTDPNREKTLKYSAYWMKQMLCTGIFLPRT